MSKRVEHPQQEEKTKGEFVRRLYLNPWDRGTRH
jgi:hypothetical protein